MSSFGPPGVNAPHPSLPKRPPPSSASPAAASSYAPTVSAPPSTATAYGPSAPPPSGPLSAAPSTSSYYGPSAPSATAPLAAGQHGQPRLAYSRTFASVGGGGGRGRGGYDNSNNNYNNSYSHPNASSSTYGPQSYGPQSYGPQAPQANTYGPQYGAGGANYGAPQIRNPFPAPSQQQPQQQHQQYGGRPSYQNQHSQQQQQQQQQSSGSYEDAQMAAQIANWQSAYMPKDSYEAGTAGPAAGAGPAGYYGAGAVGANGIGPSYPGAVTYGPDGAIAGAGAAVAGVGADNSAEGSGAGNNGNNKGDKQKTVYRAGGGKTWTDDTLLEWDPSHLRLFVGNLAGEVTDDTLLKAFSRWKSVQKARVIREKVTKKSKGFGFVSFSDADDFFQAAKEMHGKYIGSHPVVVRKSKTEIKVSSYNDHKKGKNKGGSNKNNNNDKKKKNAGNGGDYTKRDPYEPAMGPVSTGVHKHGQKTKGGLKLLG